MAGIYTADPERLSLAATMPQFLEMERSHGSLSRGVQNVAPQSESGARHGMFVAPRAGMTSLVEVLAGRLPDGSIRLDTAVRSVLRSDDTWHVSIGEQPQPERFDAVIIATPVHATARLLSEADPPLAAELAVIESASSVVVVFGFRRDQIAHPLNGFGVVVPRIERRRILAASFASIKFPGRAPQGHVVVRAFVGGALQPELTERTDVELRDLAYEELADLLGITGRESFVNIARWPHAMPQYHVGHLDRVARIEQLVAEHPGIELAGNAFRGVGIPQCIQNGEQAAQRTADWLNSRTKRP
jgi:oxygen-dependent protoporphyrinogen oxidase